jgi:hypothetical protein
VLPEHVREGVFVKGDQFAHACAAAGSAKASMSGGAGNSWNKLGALPLNWQTSTDAAINAENKTIDRKMNSICRGC